MAQMKRVPATQLKKAKQQINANPKVKITGTATSTPRVSTSMIKAQPATVSKSKPVSASKPKIAKRAPLETKRVGGIFSVPKKPKKTIY